MEQSNEHKSHECTLADQELIVACADWIQQLIDTGGKAFRMNIPARPNQDPDLLLSELVERFKDKLSQPQSEGVLQWVKPVDSETIPSFGIPVLAEMNYGVYQEIERRGHRSTGEWWILNVRRWLSPSTANTEEGPATREQQIVFAEWMGRKNVALYESGQYYYSLKGTWVFLANNFDELYELFLTEYTKQ